MNDQCCVCGNPATTYLIGQPLCENKECTKKMAGIHAAANKSCWDENARINKLLDEDLERRNNEHT